jgi:hypothetical protein
MFGGSLSTNRLPLLLASLSLIAGCGRSVSSYGNAPGPKESGRQYEIVNLTPCDAMVASVDKTGFNRNVVATVPTGGRLVIYWAPLSEGDHLRATPVNPPDGSGCGTFEYVQARLRIRALD